MSVLRIGPFPRNTGPADGGVIFCASKPVAECAAINVLLVHQIGKGNARVGIHDGTTMRSCTTEDLERFHPLDRLVFKLESEHEYAMKLACTHGRNHHDEKMAEETR